MFNDKHKPEIIHYWMITLTLTSSEEINFYVKAKTKQDALAIAEDYKFIADEPKLLAKAKSRLMLKR